LNDNEGFAKCCIHNGTRTRSSVHRMLTCNKMLVKYAFLNRDPTLD